MNALDDECRRDGSRLAHPGQEDVERALRAARELAHAGRFIEAAQLCHDALRGLGDAAPAPQRHALAVQQARALAKGALNDEALATLAQAAQEGLDPAWVDYESARVHALAGRPASVYAALRRVPAGHAAAAPARWLAARTRLADAWLDEEVAACRAACAQWAASGEMPWEADERAPLRDAFWHARADPARSAAWRERLAGDTALKVGVVWAEDGRHPLAHDRSLDFPLLGPLAAVPGLRWFGLQPGAAAQEAHGMAEAPNFLPLAACAREPNDIAALLPRLDLVISVDGPVADLAVRLGRPVWVLLGEQPHWRWLHAACHPVARGLRVFRRAGRGGWPAVVQALDAALRAWVREQPPRDAATEALLGVAELAAARRMDEAERALVALVESLPAIGADVLQAVGAMPRQAPLDALVRHAAKVAPALAWRVEDLLAMRAAAAGRLAEAWRRWDALLAAPATPAAAWLHCAAAAMVANDRQRVLRTYKAALERHPGVPELEARAGLSCEQLRARDRAGLHLERAARALPRRASVLRILSGVTQQAGLPVQALQAAVLAWPQDRFAWWALGGHLQRAGAHAAAAMCARRFATLRDDFQGYAHLGDVYFDQGEYGLALEAIERALRLRPRDADTLHARALALAALGLAEQAAEAFEAVLAIDPHHASALYRLARLRPSQPVWLARFRAARRRAAAPSRGGPPAPAAPGP